MGGRRPPYIGRNLPDYVTWPPNGSRTTLSPPSTPPSPPCFWSATHYKSSQSLSITERYSLAEMHSIQIFFFNFFFSEVQVDAFDLSPKQYFIRLQVGVSVPTQYFLRAPGGRKGTRSRVIERLRCPPDICLFSRSNGAVSWVASPISSEASHIFSVASPVF